MKAIRFTNFIDRRRAEHCHQLPKPLKRCALISITDPDREEAQLYPHAWEGVLRLKFHDVDYQVGQSYILFNKDHAKQVMSFLAKHESDVDSVLAHCEAGISRSAAVSKFVAYVYGLQFPENYMLYNKHVFRVLVELYNRSLHAEEPLDFNLPGGAAE